MKAKKLKTGRKITHSKKHRTKHQNPTQIAREKWRSAVQRCKEINKQWKNKLAEKTNEFKKKLEEISNNSYVKAVQTVATDTRRKVEAKAKALAAAEAKFEKKFEKKFQKMLAKKTKRRGKTRGTTQLQKGHTVTAHNLNNESKLTGKRRGRKSSKSHVIHQTPVTHKGIRKRGRKQQGRSATLQTSGHHNMTNATSRRGKPTKHRTNRKTTSAKRRSARR